jgi:hypothetical protein
MSGCSCELIPQRIACIKCGYPPSEAMYDLGPKHDNACKCKGCEVTNESKADGAHIHT